jgi:hypothetical protein
MSLEAAKCSFWCSHFSHSEGGLWIALVVLKNDECYSAGWLMMMSEGRDKILEEVYNVKLVESRMVCVAGLCLEECSRIYLTESL